MTASETGVSGRLSVEFIYSNRGELKGPRKVPPHRHPSWQADLIYEGSALFIDSDGAESVIGPMECVLIAPEREHAFIYRKADTRWLTFWFSLRGLEERRAPERFEADAVSRALYAALKEQMDAAGPMLGRKACALSASLEALFNYWLREARTPAASCGGLAGDAIALIAGSEGRRLDCKGLCAALGCSKSHLSHAFKKACGRSVKSYIDARRAETLKRLLGQAELRPAQIAEALGFRDSCELSRFCRRNLGLSPRQFQNSCRGN
jgi:AraC-like DNA-binding protein